MSSLKEFKREISSNDTSLEVMLLIYWRMSGQKRLLAALAAACKTKIKAGIKKTPNIKQGIFCRVSTKSPHIPF
jgi:hypothetical protein